LATSCSVDSYLGLVLLAKATSSHVSVLSLQKAIAFSVSTTVVLEISNDKKTIQNQIKEANRQIKQSSWENIRKVGAAEIQLIHDGANSYENMSLHELEKAIREQFHEFRSKSLNRVAVYKEHRLILELIRTPDNKIIRTIPER
jgi:hypothetical protein